MEESHMPGTPDLGMGWRQGVPVKPRLYEPSLEQLQNPHPFLGPGQMSYLVHKAPVLPAVTVQVAIQSDVCKGRAEGMSPQGSQEVNTGL